MVHLHYLSRLARERVTVVLTGEGSDELFAGYPRYRALGLLDRAPFVRRHAGPLLGGLARLLPGRGAMRARALFDGGAGVRIDRLATFVDAADVRAIGPALPEPPPRIVGAPAGAGLLARALVLDQQTYLETLLYRMDKMTMSVGLEARVPFLDHEVVEFAARVPLALKLQGMRTKHVVKALARRFVPAAVIDRPKKGFGVPIARWFRGGGALAEYLDLLLDADARVRTHFDAARLHAVVAEHRSGRRDHAELLWGLLNLELWQRVFLEHAMSSTEPERPRRAVTG
jgi:asparagine synthase (glutamine-hydrolysing)